MDLLDEYLLEYDLFLTEDEMLQSMFQLEAGYINESTGLISLNESFADTLKNWFEKIMKAIEEALEKLKSKFAGLFEERFKQIAEKFEDPNKPDPQGIQITNYHEYDYDKLASYTAQTAFTDSGYRQTVAGLAGGQESKDSLPTKSDILKKIYPDLYDDDLSIFDKMRKNITKSGADTNATILLTKEMLNASWDFCSKTRHILVESIHKDKELVKEQKKQVDQVAEELVKNLQMSTQNQPVQPAEVNKESFLIESYILEADDKAKAQTIKDTPQAEKKDNKKMYSKILISYIQVVTNVISAKMKLTNTIFMDKIKICTHYAQKQQWTFKKKKEK